MPDIGPVKTSFIEKVHPLVVGVRLNERVPVKSPNGMPPVQTMRPGGSKACTLGANVLSGATSDLIFIFAPGAMSPSKCRRPKVSGALGNSLVNMCQTASGDAEISI